MADASIMDYKAVFELLLLANMYDVRALGDLCSTVLKKSITVENVLDLLQTALQNNQSLLESYCLEYVREHTVCYQK